MISTINFSLRRKNVARCVDVITRNSKLNSPLTMTIEPGEYGDYSVITATGEWSADIEKILCSYYAKPTITYLGTAEITTG